VKIFISADIEGVAGVVVPQHGAPGNPEYERARRLMTEEVSAAVAGAFDGGATEVLVNDSHGPQVNLLPELLDPRAELLLGRPKPGGMFAGLDASFAGAFCTGYHSGAGRHGILSHTVSGFAFAAIRVNGVDCAEAILYGAYGGSMGVPVLLLSGDNELEIQCAKIFPGARFVVVKHALTTRAARALSPETARSRIRAAAEHAVQGRAECRPYVIPGPYRLELDMNSVALADFASLIPVAERTAPHTVALNADSMAAVISWVATVAVMANAQR
jgi:D-amino peptidase